MSSTSSNLIGRYFSFHVLRTQNKGITNCFMEMVEKYALIIFPYFLFTG
jgi:hypothetical protein